MEMCVTEMHIGDLANKVKPIYSFFQIFIHNINCISVSLSAKKNEQTISCDRHTSVDFSLHISSFS